MRGAAQCARRLKQLVRKLRTTHGTVAPPPAGDAVTQMILGIFSRNAPESKAREALDKLRASVVDYNELRVIPALEMAGLVGDLPDARLKCEDISRALNKIFAIEHIISLDQLDGMSKKDQVTYLDNIDGVDDYTRARVRLLSLKRHAVPLDAAMLAYARVNEIVDPKCTLGEAQAFLERQVSEKEALEFFALFRKQAWAEMGTAVRKGEVELIRSVPPDRTTRNMLQLIGSGGVIEPPRTPENAKAPSASAKPATAKAAPEAAAGKKTAGRTTTKRAAKPRPKTKSKTASAPRSSGTRGKTTKRSAAKTSRGKSPKQTRRTSSKAKSA